MSVAPAPDPPFQWLVLLRSGGLAAGWPQFGISLAGVAVFWLGLSLMERWFPREMPDDFPPSLIRFTTSADRPDWEVIEPRWWNPSTALIAPWESIVEPIPNLLLTDRRVSFRGLPPPLRKDVFAVRLIFAAAVWSLFGMAICRAVAVQISRERGETLPVVVRFASRRWQSTLGAPAIPAGGILAVILGLAIAAWFGRLPLIGGPALTVLSPVLFLAGLVIVVLALAIILGWPLMVAAMSVEDCDGFGAFSRSFSMLTGRPLEAIWQAFVSLVYGSLLVAAVGGVFTIALLAEAGPLVNIGGPAKWAAVLQGSHFTARWLLAAFAVSLFWSLVTWNYLLLRSLVDRKPFHDIAAGGDEEDVPRDLPIVGIPATEERDEGNNAEQMRPVATA